ncbi:NAD-dependent epimerase [bacterium]|nr:NAD-dependent epimerase [bacterium]
MATKQLLDHLPAELTAAFKGKRVLITGGLGFIGSNLAHALVALDVNVTILDALLEEYGGSNVNLRGIEDKVEVVNGNILDEELVNKLVTGVDFVFHFAGQVGYIDSKDKPFVDLDYNGRGNLIVLEALREHAPKARILFSSSRLVYGKIQTTPVTEEHPTEPLSLYGIHKLLGEKYYAYYAHNFGIHGVSVRIPNPYGPRQQVKHAKYSIVGWFMRLAMEKETIQIFGDGSQERDYIFIDDIVAALLYTIVNGQAGEAYNIGSPERMTFGDMVDAIITTVGAGDKEYLPWPEDYEKNETGDYVADTSKIELDTNWRPRVKFADGIAEMVAYYKENKELYW